MHFNRPLIKTHICDSYILSVISSTDETSPLKVSCDKPYQSEGTVSSTSTAMTSSTSAKPNVSTTTLSTNEAKNKSGERRNDSL